MKKPQAFALCVQPIRLRYRPIDQRVIADRHGRGRSPKTIALLAF